MLQYNIVKIKTNFITKHDILSIIKILETFPN